MRGWLSNLLETLRQWQQLEERQLEVVRSSPTCFRGAGAIEFPAKAA